MTALYLFLAGMVPFTALLAIVEANHDAASFATNNTLSHVKAWLWRALCVLFSATLLCFSLPDLQLLPAVIITVAMAPLFSLLFRPTLNAFRKKPWWYMGPDLFWRSKRDSALDTACHYAAWWVTGRRFGPGGVLQQYPDRLPFFIATAVEVVVAAALMVIALR